MNVSNDPLAMIERAIASLPKWRRWWAEWSFKQRGEGWRAILSAYASVDRVLCGRFETPAADWQPGLLVATDRSLLFLWFYMNPIDLSAGRYDLGPEAVNTAVPDLGIWETSYASISSAETEPGWFEAKRLIFQIGPYRRAVFGISPRSGATPFAELVRSRLTPQPPPGEDTPKT
jgi:hypothetical protein